jgi:hypothetical protein
MRLSMALSLITELISSLASSKSNEAFFSAIAEESFSVSGK